ncbi:MAG: 5'-nucleotidase C-terminal domain-containing protein, partial [Bacteroidota bacterium]
MKKLFVLALVVLMSISLFAVTSHLTILHVNDTHGHAWQDGKSGGFAGVSTVVDEIKAEVEACGGHVLVLHAGDFNTGVPESDQLDAVPDIVGMNMVGFDAVVLGNHEFDKNREVLQKQMDLLEMPVLSANIVDENDENPITPYVVFEFDNISVAVLGLTTEETAILEPIYLDNWRFANASDVTAELMPELNSNADIIVALAHLGYQPGLEDPKTTSNELAAAFSEIDVIVDGHTHTLFKTPPVINNSIIVSAVDWNKFVGRLDLTIVDGEVVDHQWEMIPLEGIEPQPKVQAAMNYFLKQGDAKLNEVIGKTEILLNGKREDVRSKPTNLANMVSDSIKWKTDADIALQNGGGIRASIQPGDITYRDILTVLPFGNTVYVMELNGKEIMDLIDFMVTIPAGAGAYPHLAGMTFTYENGQVKDVKVNDKNIEMDKVYRLATNNYLAMGGDGYEILAKNGDKGYDSGFVAADVLRGYIEHL